MTGDAAHVLQVITRSDWGGAPRVVKMLAAGTSLQTTVACGPGGRLIDELESVSVPVRVLPRLRSPPSPLADLATLRQLYRILSAGDFDLVHCHSTKAGTLGRVAARAAGVPCVFTVHGWSFYNTQYTGLWPVLRRGEALLANLTDEVVCVSEHDRRRGRDASILDPDGGTVVHNGVPPLDPDRETARRTLSSAFGIDRTATVLGAVLRLAPQKNPLALVRTAAALEERGHDVVCVLIGDGPKRAACESMVRERGVEAVLPGFREDALDLLPGFDLFLLPSRFEGFPLSVLESMHAGVPVLAYDVGGVAEAVPPEGVVPAGDLSAFIDRAEELVTSPDARLDLAARVRDRARERFTADRMVADYEQVYERTLSTH